MKKNIKNKFLLWPSITTYFGLVCALTFTLGVVSCGSSTDFSLETLPEGNATSGLALYSANCASCHGVTGLGNANSFGAPNIVTESSDSIQTAVRTGPGEMSTYSESVLSSQDLADIIAYIESI